jgi:transcriptional regulator with XRE-family HTH domain
LNVDVNISNIPKRAALTPVDGGQRMQQLEEIGARIAAARRTRGELAAQVGVSRSAVAQWETGRAGQVTANLARIAAVLDVGIEHLMQGPDKRTPSHAVNAEETAMLRLFRACAAADRQILLRTARRLALQE